MPQVQLEEFAARGDTARHLDTARTGGVALWFPHPEQRVLVYFAPRDNDNDADAAPWWEQPVGEQSGERLETQEVVDRLDADDAQHDFALVAPKRCAACRCLVPPSCLIESASLPEHYCSASCMHEMETHLGKSLTPTTAYTKFTSPLLRVEWEETNPDRADAHCAGGSI